MNAREALILKARWAIEQPVAHASMRRVRRFDVGTAKDILDLANELEALKERTRWRRAEDESPVEKGYCLALTRHQGVKVYWWDGESWTEQGFVTDVWVIAWQPLPKHPTEATNER